MTVIAAKVYDDKIEMSCDSMVTRGYHSKSTGFPPKIIEGSDFIIGFAGDAKILPLLMLFSKNHPICEGNEGRILEWLSELLDFAKSKTSNYSYDCQLLIAHKSGLFMVHDWHPIRVEDFAAIGSGYQYAESALFLGNDTIKACDVAMNFAYGCGGKITTKTIKREE